MSNETITDEVEVEDEIQLEETTETTEDTKEDGVAEVKTPTKEPYKVVLGDDGLPEITEADLLKLRTHSDYLPEGYEEYMGTCYTIIEECGGSTDEADLELFNGAVKYLGDIQEVARVELDDENFKTNGEYVKHLIEVMEETKLLTIVLDTTEDELKKVGVAGAFLSLVNKKTAEKYSQPMVGMDNINGKKMAIAMEEAVKQLTMVYEPNMMQYQNNIQTVSKIPEVVTNPIQSFVTGQSNFAIFADEKDKNVLRVFDKKMADNIVNIAIQPKFIEAWKKSELSIRNYVWNKESEQKKLADQLRTKGDMLADFFMKIERYKTRDSIYLFKVIGAIKNALDNIKEDEDGVPCLPEGFPILYTQFITHQLKLNIYQILIDIQNQVFDIVSDYINDKEDETDEKDSIVKKRNQLVNAIFKMIEIGIMQSFSVVGFAEVKEDDETDGLLIEEPLNALYRMGVKNIKVRDNAPMKYIKDIDIKTAAEQYFSSTIGIYSTIMEFYIDIFMSEKYSRVLLNRMADKKKRS